MPYLFRKTLRFFYKASVEDAYLFHSICDIANIRPVNLQLYRLAISHTSIAKENEEGIKYSNERLEYLGDAILGAIVADFLFKKFPYKDEGFLTEIRSRIVNRESLNELGKIIGLNKIVEFSGSKQGRGNHKSLFGDALEALVGAIYLDRGFDKCKFFILNTLLPNFDLEDIVNNHKNFKSVLIEYAQRENKQVKFVIISENGHNHIKHFVSQVVLDDAPISTGNGFSKKKAEQAAAEKACEVLKIL